MLTPWFVLFARLFILCNQQLYGVVTEMIIIFLFQHKLKFSQRDKVKRFITFTHTGEQTAIYCLAQNDWKLDLASDNYFQNPELYYKEPKSSVDKKKLEALFCRYQGLFFLSSLIILSCFPCFAKSFLFLVCAKFY